MDRRWGGDANGWVAVLRKARAAGLMANLELMTTAAARLAELGRPCLPHLDTLIVNDFEIGALAGRSTRLDGGGTDVSAVKRAIDDMLALGPLRWVVAHFPEGALAGGRDGLRHALGSVALPASAIAGVNGAGDAFAAGMLYALHEGWPIADGLRARARRRRRFDARGLDNGGRRLGRRMSGARRQVGPAPACRLTQLMGFRRVRRAFLRQRDRRGAFPLPDPLRAPRRDRL